MIGGISIRTLSVRFHSLTGILDQGIIGVGNLAIGLFVLHHTVKEGYGSYTICYMAAITVSGLVGSLVAGPVIASFFHQSPTDRHGFAAAGLRASLITAGSVGLVVALAGAILLTGPWRWLLIASAGIVIAATAQDYLRYYLFLQRRGYLILALDGSALAIWIGITVGLAATGMPAERAALIGSALASSVTALAAIVIARLSPQVDPARSIITYWRPGRWNLAGAAITAVQNNGHVYIVGIILSAAAVADLNASRLLMAPMSLMIVGANRTLLPALARTLSADGPTAASGIARRAFVPLLAIILIYSIALMSTRSDVLARILGPQYGNVGALLGLWVAITVLQAIDMNLSALMQAAHRFRTLALLNLWTSIPVLVAAVPMIRHFGVEGSLIVLGGGYAALSLLLAWTIYGSSTPLVAEPT